MVQVPARSRGRAVHPPLRRAGSLPAAILRERDRAGECYCSSQAPPYSSLCPTRKIFVVYGNPFWPIRVPLFGDLFPYMGKSATTTCRSSLCLCGAAASSYCSSTQFSRLITRPAIRIVRAGSSIRAMRSRHFAAADSGGRVRCFRWSRLRSCSWFAPVGGVSPRRSACSASCCSSPCFRNRTSCATTCSCH